MKLKLKRALENILEKGLSIVLRCLANIGSVLAVWGAGGVVEVGTFARHFIIDVVDVMVCVVEMLELDRISGMNC